MDNVMTSTKMYSKYQVAIPKIIRDRLENSPIEEDDVIIDWTVDGNQIILEPRKKVTVDDIIGIADDGEEWDIDKEVYNL